MLQNVGKNEVGLKQITVKYKRTFVTAEEMSSYLLQVYIARNSVLELFWTYQDGEYCGFVVHATTLIRLCVVILQLTFPMQVYQDYGSSRTRA